MLVGDLTFGQGEDFHVRIGHPLEQTSGVVLLEREAVHGLRVENVVLPH